MPTMINMYLLSCHLFDIGRFSKVCY